MDGNLSSDEAFALTSEASVHYPKKSKFKAMILSEAQAVDVLTRASNEEEPIRTAILLGLCYGLRRSEIAGLRWADIDLDNRTLHVCNTVTDYAGTIYEAESTKTQASDRTIYLREETVNHLRELQEKRKALPMDKVCTYPSGKGVTPAYLSKHIPKTLSRYGYKDIRLHDLRHTATSMLAKYLPIGQVRDFCGHEDSRTTLSICTHVVDAEKKATAAVLDGIFSRTAAQMPEICSEICSEN